MKVKILAVSTICFISYISYIFNVEKDYNKDRSISSVKIPSNYQKRDACEKQEILWAKILDSEHKNLPDLKKLKLTNFLQMTFQSLSTKKNHYSDFSPKGWKKHLHARGSVAKVSIVPVKKHGYTGIFKGARCALLRLSLTYKADKDNDVAPGLALKVLRDKVYSANVSALYSIDGQGQNYNFFANELSNIVPESDRMGARLMHRLFRRVTKYPEELLLSDMARINEKGQYLFKNIKSPRQIFFIPNSDFKFDSSIHDVRQDFASLEEGQVVYKIHATMESWRKYDYKSYSPTYRKLLLKNSTHIANIVLESRFIASEFGDSGLFFQHQMRPK